MNKFTKEIVDDLASKLLIGLTDEENKMVLDEFVAIDKSIDLINEIPNISSVEPMSYALDDFLVDLREDEDEESIPIEEALRNAGKTDGREIEVVKVVN